MQMSAKNTERGAYMKIIVMNSPKALRRLLAKIFGVEIIKK